VTSGEKPTDEADRGDGNGPSARPGAGGGAGGTPGSGEEAPYLLELYKFAIEMADRISARRATSNSFFLAVNAGLTAFIGVLDTSGRDSAGSSGQPDHFGATVIALSGIVFAGAWWLLLRSYRDLSRSKWDVITGLENRLDIRLYQDEWKLLKAEEPTTWRRRYRELGFVERIVPLLFLAIYVAFAVRILWPW
jgi:hypothetical protein